MTESSKSWAGVFGSLKERGLKDVAMLIEDGAGGIWNGFEEAHPEAKQHSHCWLHKMRNVLDKVPERLREIKHESPRAIMNAKN